MHKQFQKETNERLSKIESQQEEIQKLLNRILYNVTPWYSKEKKNLKEIVENNKIAK